MKKNPFQVRSNRNNLRPPYEVIAFKIEDSNESYYERKICRLYFLLYFFIL